MCVGSGVHLSLLKRVFSNNSEDSDFPSRKAWKVPETSLSDNSTSDTGLPVSLHFPGRGQLLAGPPGRGAPRPLTLQVGSSMEPASIPGGSLLGPWRPALYFSASLPGDTPWSGGLGWPCTHSPREGPGPAQVCGHRGRPTCWPNQLWELLKSKGAIALGLEDTAADPLNRAPSPGSDCSPGLRTVTAKRAFPGSAPPLSRARSAQGSEARACPRCSNTPTGPGGPGLPQGWPRLVAGEPSAQASPLPERGSWEPPCGLDASCTAHGCGALFADGEGVQGLRPSWE